MHGFLILWCHDCLHTIYLEIWIGKTHTQIQTHVNSSSCRLPFQVLDCHMFTGNSLRLKSWVEGWLCGGGKICVSRGVERQNQSPHLSSGGRRPQSWERALEGQSWDWSWEVFEFGKPVGITTDAPSFVSVRAACSHWLTSWVPGCDFLWIKYFQS